MSSAAEDDLARNLTLAGGILAQYQRQYPYAVGRKFAADFAWPAARLLVEVQGGVWNGKAHGSVEGIVRDIERLNAATLNGWRVLRFTPDDVTRRDRLAETLDVIERALVMAA